MLAGTAVDDPVISAAIGVQTWLARTVIGFGVGGVVVASLVVVVVVALVGRSFRRQSVRG